MQSEMSDKIDNIVMDVPLFIRMLEYAKEDANSDMDLHKVTENIIKLSKKNMKLTMGNYNSIVKLKKVETKEQTMSDSSGSFEAPMSSDVIKRPISTIPNFITKKEISENIGSSGEYDVPAFAGKGRSKNPLKIDGEKSIGQSSAITGRIPKLVKGSTYIKINDKCKKFPYCNQGDSKIGPNPIQVIKSTEVQEAINESSKKYGVPREQIESLMFKNLINEYADGLYKDVHLTFHKHHQYSEVPPRVSNEELYQSMKMIGNGKVTKSKTQDDMLKYTEELNDNTTLVVYGQISRPVMSRGFTYEIIVFSGKSHSNHIGGGYGSPGITMNHRNREFNYSTEQNVYYDISTISDAVSFVREYFSKNE